MKYLSLILVLIFLQGTWWLSQQKRDLTVSQHNKITNLIQEYMTQAVKKKEPEAKDIQFSNVYTEVVEEGKKMKAHFKFSYQQIQPDGSFSTIHRKGQFFIASSDGNDWKAQVEQVQDVQVEFMEPQTISPTNESTPSPEEAKSEEEGH